MSGVLSFYWGTGGVGANEAHASIAESDGDTKATGPLAERTTAIAGVCGRRLLHFGVGATEIFGFVNESVWSWLVGGLGSAASGASSDGVATVFGASAGGHVSRSRA